MLTLQLKESKQIIEIVCLFQYFPMKQSLFISVSQARKVRDSHARMPMQAKEAVPFCPRESHSWLPLAQFSLLLAICHRGDKISSVGQKANSYHCID